jgi:hypothetical protein
VAGTLATALAVNLALTTDAFAYIDPGTGTMLLQMVGAMIAAGLFYLRGARLWLSRRLGLDKTDSAVGSGAETKAGKPE